MVDKEMLAAMSEMMEQKMRTTMSEMMDQKLETMSETMEQKMRTTMSEMMDQKLEKFEARLEQKLNEKLAPIYERLDRLEADVKELKKLIPRVDKLEADMKYIKVVQLENNIIPRLNSIEACYVETSKRYIDRTEQIDDMRSDIKVLKNVVFEHSQKLSKISV